MLASTMFMLG